MNTNNQRHLNASETVTNDVRVTVVSEFLKDESNRHPGKFFWAYHIVISNAGKGRLQLQTRDWQIVDGAGQREVVSGPGVVGQFPELLPGESFDYNSFTYLSTSWGTMEGNYHFLDATDKQVDVLIGRFFLLPKHAETARPPNTLVMPE